MRTLQHLASHKQQVIAQETLDIYAPLANRLGISWMKIELEDLSLKYLKPEIYQKLSKLIAKKKTERSDYIETVIRILKEKTAEYGLKVDVTGRPKHFYSIYKKMESRKINFEEINDLVAFRIVTASIAECYEALGIVHMFFKPVPGRFKDYIAMPKNNMYQSLHTTVMGPFGERLEIQIRTSDMHRIAESGIAAHWEYKDGRLSEKDSMKFHWLRQLVEAQEQVKDPTEFLESVKLDLFAGDIYVFTPKGELKELPAGSTPLDFAYSIHTQLGNTCSGAKVNGRMVSLKHKLRSGDAVDIITNPGQKPSKDWLKIVKTSRAKAKIRQFIKTEERDRSRQMGYELLDRQFRRFGHSLAKWEKQKDLAEQVSALSFATFDEMLISIGYGKITPDKLVEKIFPDSDAAPPEESPKPGAWMSDVLETAKEKLRSTATGKAVRLGGLDDILVRFGKCCNPIPGDEITGFISRGRGVTVHKLGCPRVLDLDEDRRVEVHWASDLTKLTTSAKLKITVQDEPGLLNEMSRVISSTGVNIKGLNIRVGKDRKATGIFDLEVNHKDQLARCIRELEALPGVITVERVVKSP
jgi:GTP pyrophosphokinase